MKTTYFDPRFSRPRPISDVRQLFGSTLRLWHTGDLNVLDAGGAQCDDLEAVQEWKGAGQFGPTFTKGTNAPRFRSKFRRGHGAVQAQDTTRHMVTGTFATFDPTTDTMLVALALRRNTTVGTLIYFDGAGSTNTAGQFRIASALDRIACGAVQATSHSSVTGWQTQVAQFQNNKSDFWFNGAKIDTGISGTGTSTITKHALFSRDATQDFGDACEYGEIVVARRSGANNPFPDAVVTRLSEILAGRWL